MLPAVLPDGSRSGTDLARVRARAGALVATVVMAVACALGLLALGAPAASAHVVPTSTIQLDVHATTIDADVSIPVSDVAAATGLDLGDRSQAEVDGHADAIKGYLLDHFHPASDDNRPWSVTIGDLHVSTTGDPTTTGRYAQLDTTFVLSAPTGTNPRSFDLRYTAIIDRVVTHEAIVTVRSDWSSGHLGGAYEIGVVQQDTVTNTAGSLHVDLGPGSSVRGFVSMVALGMRHIQEGTDHQLFLLTLLLPAPLVAYARRWSGPVPARSAVRRIASITGAFTLGHSLTLALGALGVPAPQGIVEALIAVSILVAAVHAVRPVFPGREAVVAATFGLVHGLAFSTTLRELDLTGMRLVLSLLGFNLGIEIMQLIIVAAVLPPLILLARSGRYQTLRVVAAGATAVAAVGWLAARTGFPNPVAALADRIGVVGIPVVLALWLVALLVAHSGRQQLPAARPHPAARDASATEVPRNRLSSRHADTRVLAGAVKAMSALHDGLKSQAAPLPKPRMTAQPLMAPDGVRSPALAVSAEAPRPEVPAPAAVSVSRPGVSADSLPLKAFRG